MKSKSDDGRAALERENAELRRQLAELLARQEALGDVLQVINSSPGDVSPVFDAIVEKAVSLCDADDGAIYLRESAQWRCVAVRSRWPGATSHMLGAVHAFGREAVAGRVGLTGEVVQIPDILADPEYEMSAGPISTRVRTLLGVPLLRDGAVVGSINLGRERVATFSNEQIGLVVSFADQAVIAMENARLITETREALEQQTAAAEVLGVINSSPGDLTPVFEAMLDKAARLCDFTLGILWTYDSGIFRPVSWRGAPSAYADFLANADGFGPFPPKSGLGRMAAGEDVAHIDDVAASPSYGPSNVAGNALVHLAGARTVLCVALRKEGQLLGVITGYRREVRRFADKQIALLQNFAAQAVIAIENARLITETQEALEQQTATAELLQVINASPGDLAPVFDAMLEKANHLCETALGILWTFDGTNYHPRAIRGPQAFIDAIKDEPRTPGKGGTLFRHAVGEDLVHIDDMAADTEIYETNPTRRAFVDLAGARSSLSVSLRKDTTLLGALQVYRQEVRPFTDKQIALLQNFAAQAVIAIENARLITETREALEQQTATAEVLGVINSSPGNLAPVLDAMLEKAMRLCEASFGGFVRYDGALFHMVANRNLPESGIAAVGGGLPAAPGGALIGLVAGESIVHIADLAETEAYRAGNRGFRVLVDECGAHTAIWVALRQNETLLGAFVIYRQEVRSFSDKQVALLQNFAAQAVIAIENARLITETREALEQQTATAEVLGVINSSPGDLAPVFDAILDKAHRLCGAAQGTLQLYDGRHFRAVATQGLRPDWAKAQFTPRPPTNIADDELLAGARLVHYPDLAAVSALHPDDARMRNAVASGVRTILRVPLRRESTLLGYISAYREEVKPFSEPEIALLENFAAQAVIAMENARLINETRRRTADLQESLEYQMATADVLNVISRSAFALQPILETVVATAARLCLAEKAILYRLEDDSYRFAAGFSNEPEYERIERAAPIYPGEGSVAGRAALHKRAVQIVDPLADPLYEAKEEARIGNARSMIGVPLLREGVPIGVIALARERVEPFTERQIELVTTFADQAVIAIENARLITETQEALDQQTATAEVLGVINASPGDLAPVFGAMLEKGMELCQADAGGLGTWRGDRFEFLALRGLSPAYAEFAARNEVSPGPRDGFARVARNAGYVQLTDAATSQFYDAGDPLVRGAVDLDGARTTLTVPLAKDDEVLGIYCLYRREVCEFSDRQVALIKNFAQQAVIAIENARLINETREALEQQTATAEVLQVINSSPGDLTPVFEAILDKAHALCGAERGTLFLYDGDSGKMKAAVAHGYPADVVEHLRAGIDIGGANARYAPLFTGSHVHIADLSQARGETSRVVSGRGGVRTNLLVPLFRNGVLLGMISCNRTEVRPFSDKEIALIENFAQQAVIAIENARLINETREALEQQTATAEVLGVINSSPGDLQPVFEAILEKAHSLCGVDHGSLQLYDGETYRAVALHGAVLSVAEQLRNPRRPDPAHPLYRLFAGEPFVQVPDMAEIDTPGARNMVKLAGLHTVLYVALRRENTILGFIGCGRREVRPFTDKQVALLQNFAAQAVIAMENARLITEIRAARDAAEAALSDLRAAQGRLIQAEKMASLGQLTAGIAHEIKNPLNFVNNFASLSNELLSELKEVAEPAIAKLDRDKREELDETMTMLSGNLDKIAEHGKRADNIVKSMLEHSRGVSGERRAVDLNALVEESLNLAYHGARAQDQTFNITLERAFDAALKPIELVPQDMTRVFLNLIGNGFYAANKRAQNSGNGFRPMLKVATQEAGEAVEVRVRDNGTGIPPDIRDKLFQPFFTTKPTGEGTGLGLSISYDIVTQQHGGSIAVDSAENEFTEFTIRLPRAAKSNDKGKPRDR
ncbi:MAG TPA: GAF domain-containing protein [Stellaceae bacterium]|nr:GAF domain-containing protein [Stellaceae bacterium]